MKKSLIIIAFASFLLFSLGITSCNNAEKKAATEQEDVKLSAEEQAKVHEFAEKYVRLENERIQLEKEIEAGTQDKSSIKELDEKQMVFDGKLNEFLTSEARKKAFKEAVNQKHK